jgi:hypothetical protein
MRSITNLYIITFDYITAKDDQVSLRYSAEGSHDGEAYKGKHTLIQKSVLSHISSQVSKLQDERPNGPRPAYSNWIMARLHCE